MSLLSRAKLFAARRHFLLHSVTPLQQLYLYSTRTANTSQRNQQLAIPKSQKSAESSSTFPDRIKKLTGEQIVWPKPREIPYQAKVANFINLIGYVKTPVHFEADSDGKQFAATLISQEAVGERDCLSIPVVFEGDLAHVVACHVKENNCVLVSGQLSTEPMRFPLSDGLRKFHVVAQNLNFIDGFKRNVSGKKFGAWFSGVRIDKLGDKKADDAKKIEDNGEKFDQQWRNALEHAKVKRFPGEKDWASSSVNPQSNADYEVPNLVNFEPKREKCVGDDGNSTVRKKDGDQTLDLWRDLAKNSLLWWDYRDHKSKGLVKEKFPDFKHKQTGDGLWIKSAPKWVLHELGKLEFDVKVIKAKQVYGGEGRGDRKNDGTEEDSWKNLVKNPNKWWDNRLNKRFPNSPDFRHKETGEGLWISKAPAWTLSKLSPLKDDENTSNVKRVWTL